MQPIGDATTVPDEILQAGGSVEYNNDSARRRMAAALTNAFPNLPDQPSRSGIILSARASARSTADGQRMYPDLKGV
jgi:uncharacterized protein with von Willebrand factor type A (vWA) domain